MTEILEQIKLLENNIIELKLGSNSWEFLKMQILTDKFNQFNK